MERGHVQLIEWITSNGGYISPKLEIRELPGRGRGLVVNDRVYPNERLIHLKLRQLLNYSSIHNAMVDGGHLSETEYRSMSAHQVLALFLVIQQSLGSKSDWKAFMGLLPDRKEGFLDVPLQWSKEDQDSLTPEGIVVLKKTLDTFEADYDKTKTFVAKYDSDPRDAYLWAWLCVNSRCLYFDLTLTTGKKDAQEVPDNITLAPYVDLINHSVESGPTHCQLKTSSIGFEILCGQRGYTADEEIFLCYGPRSNSVLLCEYGFTVPENPWDDVDISDALENTFLTKQHETVLREMGYYGEYTLLPDSISFRTQVAFAAIHFLQSAEPANARLLKLFVDGKLGTQRFQNTMKAGLRDILTTSAQETEAILASSAKLRSCVEILHQSRLKIIQSLLADLTSIVGAT
ncbi:hypothetical protein B0I72DRAFT_155760 [Yarrowia lipolytica]|uniref:SET domain-containing protein n=1 Tax=Yarrowia lipolytica TaxID=4952 RepID=A0A371C4W2_YARLL|nr:hypothetical protein BKA90DRAFT_151685 [Yarrowia lipolytica]RDW25338.1 hypothetical protein B0I71DRAFT_147299 [Yarrowia lipolytica]RDW35940.1 hypothetical protein B0I72DRAFT_155760 [Yarrowia lipolytica]RDW49476.1 hypothetical protein B0I74DRAFT_155407 [Yarrowia lipolytica]RMJ00221.1 hypothetical protein BD777DRAFT_139847 [Yarrowia lipolytica]